MGDIISHQSVKQGHLLAARQWERRPPLIASDWTKIRAGALMHITTLASEDAALWTGAATNIVEANNGVADALLFGMKDADTNDMPGEANCQFWGLTNRVGEGTRLYVDGGGPRISVKGSAAVSACQQNFAVVSGATRNEVYMNTAETDQNIPGGLQADGAPPGTTLFAGFFCIEIEITDRGLATQAVTFRMSQSRSGVTPDPVNYRSQLATLMSDFALPYSHTGTVAANDGVSAFEVPTKFVIRFPFTNYRGIIYAKRLYQLA